MPMRPPVHRPVGLEVTASGRPREYRGSATARGYGYDWQKFRLYVLAARPLCEDCLPDRTTEGTELHHIQLVRDRPDLRLVESNCRVLCESCHSKRTIRGE
jgi:5-methylcytosine-specific restriction enzyme A